MGIIIRNTSQGGRITFRGLGLGGRITSGWPVASTSALLLDTYPGAAAAYSLRKLSSTYNGSAIRVRRSSDNTEQNIGFVNNQLDTASLTTFVGANTGFVTTWYDQSGNNRNASQVTAGNQPYIVGSGALNLSNGKPAIFFIRANTTKLTTAGIISGSIARSQIVVYQPVSTHTAEAGGVWGQGSNAVVGSWSSLQTRTFAVVGDPYFAGYGADLGNGLSTETLVMKIGSFYYNSTTGYLWKNNTQLTSGALTLNTAIGDDTQIGSIGGGPGTSNAPLAGNISECILYLTNQLANTTGINTNINSYYTIY